MDAFNRAAERYDADHRETHNEARLLEMVTALRTELERLRIGLHDAAAHAVDCETLRDDIYELTK